MTRVRRECALAVAAFALSGAHAAPATATACAPVFHPVPGSAQPLLDPESLAAGDFTGDARPDIAFSRLVSIDPATNAGTTGIGLLAAGPGDVFGPPLGELTTVAGYQPLVAGRLTGGEHLDLATASDATGLVVLAGDGRGRFAGRPGPALPAGSSVRAVADVNRDGHDDLLVTGPPLEVGGARLQVLLGDGAGGFVANPWIRLRSDAGAVATGDLNGDGVTDLVLGSRDVQFPSVGVLLGDGRGGFTAVPRPVAWLGDSASGDVARLAVADFNGDGHLDLVMLGMSAPQLVLARGDGSGYFQQRGRPWSVDRPTRGVSGDSLAIGRFDGDSLPDVAFSAWTFDASATQRPWITVLLARRGGGWREAPGSPYADAVGADDLTAADLDGDGFDDLLSVYVPTASSGTLHVLANAGGRSFPGYRVPIRERPPDVRMRFPRTVGDFPLDTIPDVIYGERVRFAAFLTCEPGARRGRSLALFRRLATPDGGFGRWQPIAVRVTGRRGRVAAADKPPGNAQYQWRAADPRDPPLRRGPMMPLTVAPHVTLRLDRGGAVSGRVHPARAGRRIRFFAIESDGEDLEQLKPVGSAKLGRSGVFHHARLRGGSEYIAVLPTDGRYTVGLSRRFG
jgi:hypothetical protein